MSLFAQDPREKNHSISILPFTDGGIERYYITWSSSSGSNDGWQHDIYNQIISFTKEGEMKFENDSKRFIGTGYDEAQEPVNVCINPNDNTMLSVWEDCGGSSVDIRGQVHKPDGTIIKSNWIISGGEDSQHSPDVIHLKGKYLVSLTNEASPAQTSMNVVQILNDQTGEEIGSLELSPRDKDQWWTIATSNDENISFFGWGDGESFFGSVIKLNSNTITKTDQRLYISNIEQYYYSVAWLEHLSKFIVIGKVGDNSAACFIDTSGIRSNFLTIPDAPITRETDIAVSWNEVENEYKIIYTSGEKDLALLSISENSISLTQINKNILVSKNWPTNGIACQFVKGDDGNDLWNSKRKILIAYNDENSNNAKYLFVTFQELTDIKNLQNELFANELFLYPAYPNPFNPSVKINYFIPSQMGIKIKIYNLRGELVTTLVNSNKLKGNYSVEWNGLDNDNHEISSGIYIAQLTTGNYIQSQKIIFQK